jgi:hypothetical protein
MIDLIIGIAIGTAFAPFWIMVWNKYGKTLLAKIIVKKVV